MTRTHITLLAGLLVACQAEVAEPPGHEGEPHDLGVTGSELSSFHCAERTTTGYSRGTPTTIRVITVDGKAVERNTATAYYHMARSAERAGVQIRIVSGFRSMDEQRYLYHCYTSCSCNSCNLAAVPGYSNHQSGHALDLNTRAPGVLAWLNRNAGYFGFRRTVPSEDWHWEWWGSPQSGGPCGRCSPRGETCDGVDNDCDGRTDESLSRRCGTDVGECRRGRQVCSRGRWGACTGGVGPRAEDCNGRDDDCDGRVDDIGRRACGTDVGECVKGSQACVAGGWGACVGGVGPVDERCDELDNDCDGESDDEQVCEIEELALQASLHDDGTDVDGDGRSDACAFGDERFACHLASGHGFEQAFGGPIVADGFEELSRMSTVRLGDIDGDELADVCMREADGLRCWRSSGHGFDSVVGGPPLSNEAGFASAAYYTGIRMADVTGDGLSDICARWADGLRCYPSTGSGFGAAIHLPELSDDKGFAAVEHYGTLRIADVTGDGRADVCARDATGMRCWIADEHGFGTSIVGPAWTDENGFTGLDYWSTIRLADVDGDGRSDLCARTPQGFECHPSTGWGFGNPYVGPTMRSSEGWSERSMYATIALADVDGDGQSDLCAREQGGMSCWLFDGRGFERRIPGPALSDAAGWTEPGAFRTIRLGDIDGDERADICAREQDQWSCWRSDGRGFPIAIPGPAWSDDEGWDEPVRFGSIRLGGVPAAIPIAPVEPPVLHSDASASASGLESVPLGSSSTTCAASGSGRDGAAFWLAVVGVLAVVHRRRR